MRSNQLFVLALALPLFASLSACSAARDVEIKGTVSADHVHGAIFVEFYDVQEDAVVRIDTLTLAEPGVFRASVPLEGDKVLVRAIDDADGNEACTSGEQWWEVKATIKHGEIPPLGFPLQEAPCPE
jgi:hypothetical protein